MRERNTLMHSSLIPYLKGQNLGNIFMDEEHGKTPNNNLFVDLPNQQKK